MLHPREANSVNFNSISIICFLITAIISTLPAMTFAAPTTRPIEIVLSPEAVDKPTIFVHLPSADHNTGAAIIVCPGGGYSGLTMDTEGHDTAQWFADRGIAGIVLKYRLPGRAGNNHASPLEDAHAAIRQVREHAEDWKIDPHRVGILGYSAGGHVASTAGTHFDAATRPDFMMLIYAVITMTGQYAHEGSRDNPLGHHPDPDLVHLYSNELQVTKQTPQTFLATASDDTTVNAMNSVNFYSALLKAGVPAELHIYTEGQHGLKGGRGWGIGNAPSTSISSTWPERSIEWMKQRGLIHG